MSTASSDEELSSEERARFEALPLVAYPPALFAAIHTGTDGDVDFYRRVCTGARSVLEFGCGFGRIAKPLYDDGLEVVGLDLSEGLMAMAPAGPTYLREDMRKVSLGRTFDRVILPYNGMYCMLDQPSVDAVLARAKEHLAPGGYFVFDAYAADAFHDLAEGELDAQDEFALVKEATFEGAPVEVFERSDWEPAQQRIDATYVHRVGEQLTKAQLPQRYLLSHQIVGLFERAGLSLVALHGGFDQHAFDEDSPLLIATATHLA